MLCYHRDSHYTYLFCKQGGQKIQNYMNKKLSHFQVYDYGRVASNVL